MFLDWPYQLPFFFNRNVEFITNLNWVEYYIKLMDSVNECWHVALVFIGLKH